MLDALLCFCQWTFSSSYNNDVGGTRRSICIRDGKPNSLRASGYENGSACDG